MPKRVGAACAWSYSAPADVQANSSVPGAIDRSRDVVLEALYRMHRDRIVRWFRRRGHRSADLEDMLQEVFLRMSAVSDALLFERSRAMLYRVVRFVSSDVFRGRLLRRESGLGPDVHAAESTWADDAPTPEELLILREGVRSLYAIAEELPRRCREATVLNRIHGWSQKEIAARRGVASKTVANQIMAGSRHFDQRAQAAAGLALASHEIYWGPLELKSGRRNVRTGRNEPRVDCEAVS